MKTNPANRKRVYGKQSSNELVSQTPVARDITLYNSENPEYLSEKCINLQSLLLNIAEVDYLIETATFCLPAIQDLMNTSRTLIRDISNSEDMALWPTYSGMFGEMAIQIEALIAEASYKNRNLLCGDTISLVFSEDESYNFTITGKNLTTTVQTLKGLVADEPFDHEYLYQMQQRLEENNHSIKALNVILESTSAVIRSKRVFTQKLLHRFTMRLNAVRYEHDEAMQLETGHLNSLSNRLQDTRYAAPNMYDHIPGPVSERMPALGFEGTPEAFPIAEEKADKSEAPKNDKQSAPVKKSPKPKQKQKQKQKKKKKSDGGLISLFPLFRSGQKGKEKKQQGIRTILDRLQSTEADMTADACNASKEPPADGSENHKEYLNQICMEIVHHLHSDKIPTLEAQTRAGLRGVYADYLSKTIVDDRREIARQIKDNPDMQTVLEKFEKAFHILVKEQYKQAPEDTETYVRDWLNSNYGAIYKVVYPALRNQEKQASSR